MGRASRPKPLRLTEKLIEIRKALGASQNELLRRMGLQDQHLREEISDFERGKRIPPLPVLLAYARTVNVYVDALIDDDLDLPETLPSKSRSAGLKRKR